MCAKASRVKAGPVRCDVLVEAQRWPLKHPFTISRGRKQEAHVVAVTIEASGYRGRGESVPYARYGETVEDVVRNIERMAPLILDGLSRQDLLQRTPAGAARNAIDCALWDLEFKQGTRDDTKLPLEPLPCAYTITLNTAQQMAAEARKHADWPVLKLKLGAAGDLQRLRAVRNAAPKAALIVDANEAWRADAFFDIAREIESLGVAVVEQPLPASEDHGLRRGEFAFALCADESCRTRDDLAHVSQHYDMINIKLDKTGGLTAAMRLASEATSFGLRVMTGCMVATSLAMAPAMCLWRHTEILDLDGPLFLREDRAPGIQYKDGFMHPPPPELWG